MIDLNKKYRTISGNEVVLYEILGDKVYGRIYTHRWSCCEWDINGKYELTQELDLEEIPALQIQNMLASTKTVVFFGYSVTIPELIGWLAIDTNGVLYGFTSIPEMTALSWKTVVSGHTTIELGKVDYIGDWKQSLVQV